MSAEQHIQPRRIPAWALPITVICFCSLKHAVSILVSILLTKCACIMRKIIVNPLRFSHRKDFRKRNKAFINKEKPAITMDCWFSIFWCSSGDSNPGDIDVKPLKMQYFSIIVSILVSILRKEIANPVHLLRYVRIRKVRIDLAHNLVVFPAAQTHGYHHRNLQMIA